MDNISTFVDLIGKDVLAKYGTLGLIIILMALIIAWLFRRSLDDKDKTISELREETKHYRELFKSAVDEKMKAGQNITSGP